MTITVILLIIVSVLLILATLASIISLHHWWVRIFDFPRVQISVLILIVWVADIWHWPFDSWYHWSLSAGLLLAFIYQAWNIFPYTRFRKTQVKRCKIQHEKHVIKLLISNVLTPNRQADKLIKQVRQYQPDILLTLESDAWWEDQLSDIESDFPYTVKVPLDNLYGMHLYSKLELSDTKVQYLVQQDIPSITSWVNLRDGRKIRIYCLHPMPPSPSESDTSTNRDAELLLVAKKIEDVKEPVLVFGDLNDVAWSTTTRMFRKISGLLDPRIGRGFFNTFHAKYPLLRWPLDHIFHSTDFSLLKVKRLPYMGSDHFPMYVSLHLDTVEHPEHEEPESEEEDQEWADEKIDRADPLKKVVMKLN